MFSGWFLSAYCMAATLNCIVPTVVIHGAMAEVCNTSKKAINGLNIFAELGYTDGNLCRRDVKTKEKALKSFKTLKVRFGSLIYIDRFTPLTCMSFANDVTVSILLIF